jgi:hypothetical protein
MNKNCINFFMILCLYISANTIYSSSPKDLPHFTESQSLQQDNKPQISPHSSMDEKSKELNMEESAYKEILFDMCRLGYVWGAVILAYKVFTDVAEKYLRL